MLKKKFQLSGILKVSPKQVNKVLIESLLLLKLNTYSI